MNKCSCAQFGIQHSTPLWNSVPYWATYLIHNGCVFNYHGFLNALCFRCRHAKEIVIASHQNQRDTNHGTQTTWKKQSEMSETSVLDFWKQQNHLVSSGQVGWKLFDANESKDGSKNSIVTSARRAASWISPWDWEEVLWPHKKRRECNGLPERMDWWIGRETQE